MNMKLKFLIVIFLFGINVQAQINIHGYIYDKSSGETLIGAYIYEPTKKIKTTSNTYGYYTMSIPEGVNKIIVSYIGYKKSTEELNLTKDTIIDFYLSGITIDEIVILGNKDNEEKLQDRIEMGRVGLNIENIKSLPTVFGEFDIMKTLSLTPGIKLGIEGMTGLSVRGGSPDQNYILLDDAPVYNLAHLFGFVSVFNGDAIKKFDVWKSSFPARYGGRLSSIIDIKMKEGNKKRFRADLGFGLLASRVLLEGPINRKASYMFSARSSYLDIVTFPLKILYNSGKVSDYFNYRMLDVNAKINYTLTPKSKLFLSYYQGIDNLAQKSRSGENDENSSGGGLDWGNRTFTLRYYKELKPDLFFTGILYNSHFFQKTFAFEKNTSSEYKKDFDFSNKTGLNDIGLKLNLEYLFKNKHYIKTGLEIIKHDFTPINLYSVNRVDSTIFKKKLEYGNFEGSVFAEDQVALSEDLSTNVGLRLSAVNLKPGFKLNFEPRISFKYDLPNDYALKFGISKMSQYINWTIGSQSSLPFDVWLPATKKLPGQSAWHYGLGLHKTFVKNNVDFSLELYYKKMKGLVELREGLSPLLLFTNSDSLYQIVANDGIGKAYGMELFLHKKIGRFSGWISYALSWNYRKFDRLNNGKWYPHAYDRRHELSLVMNYQINRKWKFSANWVYHSGNRVTVPTASFYPQWASEEYGYPEPQFIYSAKNNGKMSDYHRLDISLSKTWTSKRKNTKTFQISIYNVYNRANAMRLFAVSEPKYNDKNEVIGYKYKMVQRSFLPIIPSFSFSIKFDRKKSEELFYEPNSRFEF